MENRTRIVQLVSGKFAVQKLGNFSHWFTEATFDTEADARHYRVTAHGHEVERVIE